MSAIIEVRDVCKHFGGVAALTDVSIDIPERGVLGLIGPNGAGKTTLFNVLSGHVKPDEGNVSFRGVRVDGTRPSALTRMGIARSWQDVRIFKGMTVLDNVMVGFRTRFAEHPLRSLLRARQAEAEGVQVRTRALAALERVGFDLAHVHDLAEDLAFGDQKIVAVARLLIADPAVLLLDEPASGLDADGVTRLLGLVRAIADDGVPVLIVEHNLSVVRAVADTAVFMSNGKVVAVDSPDSLVRRPDLIELYFGSRWSK